MTGEIPLKRKLVLVCFAGEEKVLFGVILRGRGHIQASLEGWKGQIWGWGLAQPGWWHTELLPCVRQEILEPRDWIGFCLGCFSRTWRKIWLI